jgi:hypothetical protein
MSTAIGYAGGPTIAEIWRLLVPDDRYTIRLPVYRAKEASPILVLPSSHLQFRKNVERFARYFLREMNYSGIQFEAAETPSTLGYVKYEAYLFHAKEHFIGAGCFRWREWENAAASWSFDWVWVHPYLRRQGHLSAAWPQFEEKYGRPFHLARPVSPAMQAFLQTRGWPY